MASGWSGRPQPLRQASGRGGLPVADPACFAHSDTDSVSATGLDLTHSDSSRNSPRIPDTMREGNLACGGDGAHPARVPQWEWQVSPTQRSQGFMAKSQRKEAERGGSGRAQGLPGPVCARSNGPQSSWGALLRSPRRPPGRSHTGLLLKVPLAQGAPS